MLYPYSIDVATGDTDICTRPSEFQDIIQKSHLIGNNVAIEVLHFGRMKDSELYSFKS
jgi:hypothetical protein